MSNPSTEEFFKKLQESYIKSQFSNALDLVVKEGQSIPAGQYNFTLGTLYAKAGQMAASRFHLEKALNNGFVPFEVRKNIDYVQRHLPEASNIEQTMSIPEYVWSKSLDWSISECAGLTLMLLIVLVTAQLLLKSKSTFVFLSCLLIGLVPVSYSVVASKLWSRAIVLNEGPLFEGPSKIFKPGESIPAGLKVVVQRPNQGWAMVISPTSQIGWVPLDQLGVL